MISVILPTYNEAENIINLIESLFRNINQQLEIIVVDDDSSDLTWKIAEDHKRPRVKVLRRIGERGLSTAIDAGIKEAKGEVIGWMDADMSMPAELLPEMLGVLNSCDIVIGSRYARGGKDARGWFRVLTSRIINGFAGLLLGNDIKDYDSGFIVFKRAVLDKVTFPASGYGDYFIEFIYKCKRKGFRIKEVPYIFKDRQLGESKTSSGPLKFALLGFGYFLRIIKIRMGRIE
jgi:dolichol-phosphate mannosyltransferase